MSREKTLVVHHPKAGTKGMPAAERRSQLLGIGRNLFAAQGFEATSLDAIAAEAGVTKPVVYRHFANKEALFSAIVDDGIAELRVRLFPALAAETLEEAIDAAALAFLGYVRDSPSGFATLAGNSPISWAVEGARPRPIHRAIALLYSKHLEPLTPSLADAAAFGTLGMVMYYGQWWTRTHAVPFDEAVRILALMLRGQLASLRTIAAGAVPS